MANIKVIIEEPNKPVRESIHPEASLKDFQRVYGKFLVDYYVVDAQGNKVKDAVLILNETPQEKALRMMRKEAERLQIKGFEKMSESELLKAIQTINNNSSNITETVKVTKTGKVKTRKQNG